MAGKSKSWTVTEAGITVRLYRRKDGGPIHAEMRGIEGFGDGKMRRSLGTTDRETAEAAAKVLAREEQRARLDGRKREPDAPITLGGLVDLYFERNNAISDKRAKKMRRMLDYWRDHLEPGGRSFPVADLSAVDVENYAAARRSGRLKSSDHRANPNGVRDGTIMVECQALMTLLHFACETKSGGEPILANMPLGRSARKRVIPQEAQPRRPRAGSDRLAELFKVAERIDKRGQFRLMLTLASRTGRRINSILHLRASDLLLDVARIRSARAEAGDDLPADEWGAAIRWRAEWDKAGNEWFTPCPDDVKAALDAHIRRQALVGDVWLFPYSRRPGEPVPNHTAGDWLRRAEKLAGLPHVTRGGWHAFRRQWATERKAAPQADLMAVGGWKHPGALQRAYAQADADTMARVARGETA